MKFVFHTVKTSLPERETLVLKLSGEDGNVGYGEIVSFKEPFYTEETLEYSKKVLEKDYIPYLLKNDISHPFSFHEHCIHNVPMAECGVENALLDLYARQQGENIISMVFREQKNPTIALGIVIGDLETSAVCTQIEKGYCSGCRRFKVKINPDNGVKKLQEIRKEFPHIMLLADANQSFPLSESMQLKELDPFNLLCLEEPFAVNNILDYKKIQKEFQTPICLDETIQTLEDLKTGIQMACFQVLNIKAGRVGGLYYAREMIHICRQHGIRFWIGSMVETGISKILHVQMAALKDVYIPGDLSDSTRYFEEDVIKPPIQFEGGRMKVPDAPGIGVEINENVLRRMQKEYQVWER